MKAVLAWIGGSLAAMFLVVRSVFLIMVRLRLQHGKALFDLIVKEGKRFVVRTEWYYGDFPREMSSACLIRRIPMMFRVEERLLRAGFEGTDSVVRVTIFRWNFKRLLTVLEECAVYNETKTPVFLAQAWEAEKIGQIAIPEKLDRPYLLPEEYRDVEREVEKVLQGEVVRTGVILHGRPGNGKTFFVKWLAMRFKLPVYLLAFKPDYDNHNIIRIFAHIKPPAIVLFEDFDSYFDGRRCKLKEAKFSFDVVLNVLDGIFSENRGIVACMTVNDISRVDDALKARPSRFRFVKHIGEPVEEVRRRILHNNRLVEETVGCTLDEVLHVKTIEESKEKE